MTEHRIQPIFKDKKIVVVGLARSGIGAANLLSSLGAKVCVTDIKSQDLLEDNVKKLLPSIEIVTGGHPEEIFNKADLIVVSPGVPLDIPPFMHAKAKGIPIIGELELAYQVVKSKVKSQKSEDKKLGRWEDEKLKSATSQPLNFSTSELQDSELKTPAFIGITGTNGKSTTTTLIDLMIRKSGFKTLLGGNIGNALTEEILKLRRWPDFIVTEVSSFQLESIQDFSPFVAVILNITPDHLNRYSSMQEYIDAKAEIFRNQGHGNYLILNADDPIIKKVENEKLKVKSEKPKLFYFSRKREVEGIYLKNGRLYCNFLSPPFDLITVDEIKVKGIHNLENVMAASLSALICGCSEASVSSVLRDFSGLEHRLEFVCEIGGVSFINDSKGTNVGAVIKSLESFQTVVLIMGGRDKDGDFTVLRDLIKEKVRALILLGEAKEKIAEAVGSVTDTILVRDMKEAVEVSMSKACAGDVVLLSPGCASFDMFIDFEDRGKKFKEAVYAIKNSKSQIPNYK